ncbi:MAG: BON domain-containing protein [Verrucomicrobiota bacterium]|jgi:osmotically-inducible protein OsmY
MKITIKKCETAPKQDARGHLKCGRGVEVTDIGAFMKDWAMALEGKKGNGVSEADWAAIVKEITGGIELKPPGSQRPTDKEIAATAANQIYLSKTVPKGTVGIMVHEGWITLEGEVEWCYQKNYAENAVEWLAGVKGVSNQIRIKRTMTPAEIEMAIVG